ncbi:unnamed protein product, partial [Medioppia subpectinata]
KNDDYVNSNGLAAVNNFGIGGANAHVLLGPNPKVGTSDGLRIAETIPRIVNICGRTEDAVKYVMDFIQNNPKKVTNDFLALLAPVMRFTPDINSGGMPFRGSMIISKISEANNETKYEYKRQIGVMKGKTIRPLWVLFPGLGGQWPAMAKALMSIKIFADKVEECHQILHEFGVDLKHMLLSEDKTAMSSMTAKFCSTTAIEIALFERWTSHLDITPDGIIGHSFGEIACAYADGCLTTSDAMVVTYFRGAVIENDNKIPKGLMAVVGLPSHEAIKVCPKGVYVACNNAKDTVVVSGTKNEMQTPMIEAIKKYIPNPKLRSQKWVSTSLMTTDPDDQALEYASAEYFVYNLLYPVQFYDRLKYLPSDAIVLELGPHSLFGKIVTETLDNCTYISLIKKGLNNTNLGTLFNGLAKLYEAGVNMSVENLYTKVEWPVVRSTQSISSIVRWEHNKQIPFGLYPKKYNLSTASDYNYTFDPVNYQKNKFYLDHCVDGNAIFPAAGYLMLAWRKLAAGLGRYWYDVPVVFENVQFKRPVFLNELVKTVFTVRYLPQTDEFCVLESDNVCVVGKVRAQNNEVLLTPNAIFERQKQMARCQYSLDKKDIYKKLRVLGLDYGPHFQRLRRIQTNDFRDIYGIIEWDGNFVTYLDSMLQSALFIHPNCVIVVPVMIRTVRVDPRILFNALRVNHNLNHHSDDDTITLLSNPASVLPDNDSAKYPRGLNNLNNAFNRRFCIFSAKMPFHFNRKSKRFVANGLEMEGVISQPITRRTDVENIVLESDMNKIVNEIIEKPEYELSKDMINQIQKNERLIRSLVDIVCENFITTKELKVTEINMTSNLLAKEVEQNIKQFKLFPFHVDYKLVVKSKQDIHKTYGNWIVKPGGENFRYIFHMDTNTVTNIDFNTKPYSDILANNLVANVIKGGELGTYRHFKLPADYDKIESNEYHLNFGQIRRMPIRDDDTFSDCVLGTEYVGRRADTGERVMGMESGRTFANSVKATDKYMTTVPEHWSMAEAVTVLSAYSTVHYGLIKKAYLKKVILPYDAAHRYMHLYLSLKQEMHLRLTRRLVLDWIVQFLMVLSSVQCRGKTGH